MISLNIWDKFEDLLPPTDLWQDISNYDTCDDLKCVQSKVEINDVIDGDACLKKLLDLDENNGEIDSCSINPCNLEIKFSEQLDHSYYSTKNKPQGSQRVQKNNSKKTTLQRTIQQVYLYYIFCTVCGINLIVKSLFYI